MYIENIEGGSDMNWLKNLSVGTKLISGFLAIAAIAAAIGIVGIVKIRTIDDADKKLYEKVTLPLGQLLDISVAFQRARINLRDAAEETDPAKRAAFLGTIGKLRAHVSEQSDKFEKTIITEEGRLLFNQFKESRTNYGRYLEEIDRLVKSGKQAEALALIHGPAKAAALHEQGIIDKLVSSKKAQAKLLSDENTAIAGFASRFMTILVILGTIMAVLLGYLISKRYYRSVA
jgi:methyl-accepting chemotaxis protein